MDTVKSTTKHVLGAERLVISATANCLSSC